MWIWKKKERIAYDIQLINEVGKVYEVEMSNENVSRVRMLNREAKNKPSSYLLSSKSWKEKLLKSKENIKNNSKMDSERTANDLTKTEREKEKELYLKVKSCENKTAWELTFNVIGPPWDKEFVHIF